MGETVISLIVFLLIVFAFPRIAILAAWLAPHG